MTNSAAFLCSIKLLLFLLSFTDGLHYDERWDARRTNIKRWNNQRWDDGMWNNGRSNVERWNEGSWDDGRWDRERRNDEIWDRERRNEDRRYDERWNENRGNENRRNDERRNEDRGNENRRNNDRRNEDRGDENRRNGDRRNEDRGDENRRNGDRRNEDRVDENRRNGDRRNEDRGEEIRRNGDRQNEDRGNENRRNGDRLPSSAEKCPADNREDWSYRGNNGPQMWSRRYPECGGRTQSPIAINNFEANFVADVEKLKLQNYNVPVERARFENDGHTVQMTPSDNTQRVIQLDSRTYRLGEVHFHWGDDKNHGSEHTIDSIHYALEMHLVHQSGNDRTAVVAVLFREQSQPNKDLQNIVQLFPKLMYKDNRTELKSPINLNNLLPANPASYYWYEGSLTTPPCTEGVQWMVLRKELPVGTKQMAEFRKLYSSSKADSNEHCKISSNNRPLQPRNGRQVVVSQ